MPGKNNLPTQIEPIDMEKRTGCQCGICISQYMPENPQMYSSHTKSQPPTQHLCARQNSCPRYLPSAWVNSKSYAQADGFVNLKKQYSSKLM